MRRKVAAVVLTGLAAVSLTGCVGVGRDRPACTAALRARVDALLAQVHAPPTGRVTTNGPAACDDSVPAVFSGESYAFTTTESDFTTDLQDQLATSGWARATPTAAGLSAFARSEHGQTFWAQLAHDPLSPSQITVTVTAGDAPYT